MPTIVKFYGIIIKMFFLSAEHNPPHIHALYGEYSSLIDIVNLLEIEGDLPPKAKDMVLEWCKLYQKELLEMWENQDFKKLPPLE